ncbi:hypothetical protein GYMLUDRAFT_245809 [Collybiopsis luxurians FD-317 M1]|uniref:Uncharacterized protein n=1 Tax=Collybiopsis luxurians FD-317 M1 TaxID=944289 RepID=A0A0D0BTH4_9AGAR|nr:hypothetical protein GYMLUDRAFT_245809 [Collybiopsis luxurians FD-317 M1]
MIEEVIHNGTYISPNVLTNARGKVDLAKKPKMWEANVYREAWDVQRFDGGVGAGAGGKEKGAMGAMGAMDITRGGGAGTEWGWGDIFPVAASISSTSPSISGLGLDTAAGGGDASSDANDPTPNGPTLVGRLRAASGVPVRVAASAWRLISPGRSIHSGSGSGAESPANSGSGSGVGSGNTNTNNSNSNANGNGNGNGNNQLQQPHQTLPTSSSDAPTHVEVAVLIAMPGALAAAAHRAKLAAENASAGGGGGYEEELPRVEVGMAEVVVPPLGSGSSSSGSSLGSVLGLDGGVGKEREGS